MDPIKEFVTAVDEAFPGAEADDKAKTLMLDGEELTYFDPTEGQMLIYMAETGRHSTNSNRVAAIVNFFMELFDESSREHLIGRLMDRNDKFGVSMIEEMLESLTEEWTGRPTQSPAASTQSPRNGGRKSTPRTPRSTSSVSQTIGS